MMLIENIDETKWEKCYEEKLIIEDTEGKPFDEGKGKILLSPVLRRPR